MDTFADAVQPIGLGIRNVLGKKKILGTSGNEAQYSGAL